MSNLQKVLNAVKEIKGFFFVEYTSEVKLKKSWTGGKVEKTQGYFLTRYNYSNLKKRFGIVDSPASVSKPSWKKSLSSTFAEKVSDPSKKYVQGRIVKTTKPVYTLNGKPVAREVFKSFEYAKKPSTLPLVNLPVEKCTKISAGGFKFTK